MSHSPHPAGDIDISTSDQAKITKLENKLKQRVIEQAAPTGTPPGRYKPPDALLAFLDEL